MSLVLIPIKPIDPSKDTLDTLSSGDHIDFKTPNVHSVALQLDSLDGANAWGTARISLTCSANGINYHSPPFPYTYEWGAEGLYFVTVAGFPFTRLSVTAVNAADMKVRVSLNGTNEAID